MMMTTTTNESRTPSPLAAWVEGIVREITEAKEDNTIPCAAHISEIRLSANVEITEALRELCRIGRLSVNLDVNKNPMFTINRLCDG